MSSSHTFSRYFSALNWARQNYHAISAGHVTFQRTNEEGDTQDVTAEVREYLCDIIEIVEDLNVEDRRMHPRA